MLFLQARPSLIFSANRLTDVKVRAILNLFIKIVSCGHLSLNPQERACQ
jgi:hypothetical protein